MKFLRKIFSTCFLIFSFSLFYFVFYKDQIIWSGQKNNFLIYYIVSIILIFFSILTFFINKKIKDYLIIISISIITSFYTIEFYLTSKEKTNGIFHTLSIQNQNLKKNLYKKKTGKDYDTRTKIEIYKDLKKLDEDVKLSTSSDLYEDKIHTLSGISNVKTILCNENGYYSIYKSDRYGFNNPDNEWDQKSIEFLLVGDSFTVGACVNRPYDIGSMLRKISEKSVLNLAYTGNAPLKEYATLKEYLGTNVKKILWFYYEGNDLADLKNEMNSKILMNYLERSKYSQNLKKRQKEINYYSTKKIEEVLRGHENRDGKIFNYYRFFKLTMLRSFLLNYYNFNKEFRMIMRSAKDLAIENNSKLYFIYLPEYSRYDENIKNIKSYKTVKKIVNELGISFIDIHEKLFLKANNPLDFFPFGLPGHYNQKGYKKIAEIVYKETIN